MPLCTPSEATEGISKVAAAAGANRDKLQCSSQLHTSASRLPLRIQAQGPKQLVRHVEEANVLTLAVDAVARLHDVHLETLDGRTMVLERGLEQA